MIFKMITEKGTNSWNCWLFHFLFFSSKCGIHLIQFLFLLSLPINFFSKVNYMFFMYMFIHRYCRIPVVYITFSGVGFVTKYMLIGLCLMVLCFSDPPVSFFQYYILNLACRRRHVSKNRLFLKISNKHQDNAKNSMKIALYIDVNNSFSSTPILQMNQRMKNEDTDSSAIHEKLHHLLLLALVWIKIISRFHIYKRFFSDV